MEKINKKLLEKISKELNVKEEIIEKNFYITQLLKNIHDVKIQQDIEIQVLGSVALVNGYQLLERSIRNLDLSVTILVDDLSMDISQTVKAIKEHLLSVYGEDHVFEKYYGNYRYFRFRIKYMENDDDDNIFKTSLIVEGKLKNNYFPPVDKSIISLFNKANNLPAEIRKIKCVNLADIAALEFVSLTRKVYFRTYDLKRERTGRLRFPPFITRYMYDIYKIYNHLDKDELYYAIRKNIKRSSYRFMKSYPKYIKNPIGQTENAINILETDSSYLEQYNEYMQDYVYGEAVDYSEALSVIKEIFNVYKNDYYPKYLKKKQEENIEKEEGKEPIPTKKKTTKRPVEVVVKRRKKRK